MTCQWTAGSALTFISPPDTPTFAAGVFFDGRRSRTRYFAIVLTTRCRLSVCALLTGRALVVRPARAPLSSASHVNCCRFLGSSVRTCVVGAIPPSHRLELGDCSRPLSEGNRSYRFISVQCRCSGSRLFAHNASVIAELRCSILHSRDIMLSSHEAQRPRLKQPAFSAVVVERLHVKEIGEFVSQAPRLRLWLCHVTCGAGSV